MSDSSNLSLLISAILDKKSYEGIELQIKNLQSLIDKSPIKIKLDIDNDQIKQISSNLQQLSKSLNLNNSNSLDKYTQIQKEQLNIEKQITQAKMKQGSIIDAQIAQREKESSIFSTSLKEQMQAGVQAEKEIQTQQKKSEQLQHQIELFKQQKQIQLQNFESSYSYGKSSTPEIKNQVSNLYSQVSDFNPQTLEEYTAQTQKMNTAIAQTKSNLNTAAAEARGFGNDLVANMGKLASWTIVTTALFSAIHSINQGVQDVIDLNTNLTQTATAMNTTVEQLGQIAVGAQQMSQAMGANINDVLQIMHVYANVNETADSIIKKTRADVILSNLSGMNGNETTTILQAIQQQFNLTDDQLMHVDDALTKIASNLRMNYQTAIKEVGEGVKTAGTMAQQAGFSFEQFGGILGSTMERTRRSGSEIANAMKQIFARVGQIKSPDVEITGEDTSNAAKALKSIDVDVIDKQTNQLRNMNDILSDVAAKWDTLTSDQKAYVSFNAAATRQYSVFEAIMQGWSKSTDLATQAINSNGYALKQQQTYMESTEAKIKTFESTMTSMWQNTISSKGIGNMISSLTDLIKTFGDLKTILTVAGTAFLLWQGSNITKAVVGMKDLSLATKLASSDIVLFKEVGTAMQMQEMGMLTTTQALRFSFLALGNSIKAAFISNPIGIIALGITAIVSAVDMFNQNQEEMKQKIEDASTAAKDEVNSLTELIGKYNEYNSLQNKDETARTQIKSVQQEMIKLLGLEKNAIDLVNGSYDDNIAKIRTKSEAELKAAKQSLQVAYNLAKNETKNTKGTGSFLNQNEDYYSLFPSDKDKTAYDAIQKNVKGFKNQGDTPILARELSVESTNAEEKIKVIQNAIDMLQKLGMTDTDVYNQLVTSQGKYQDALKKEKSALEDLVKVSVNNSTLWATPNENSYSKFRDSIVATIAQEQNLTTVTDEFKNTVYDQVDSLFPQYATKVNSANVSVDKFASVVAKADNQLQEFNDKGQKNPEFLANQFKKVEDSVSDLNNAIDKLNKGDELSSDDIANLLTKHQELAGKVEEVNGVYSIRLDVLEQVRNSEIDTQMAAFKANTEIKNDEWNSLKERLEQYGFFYDSLDKMIKGSADGSVKPVMSSINEDIARAGREGNAADLASLYALKESMGKVVDRQKILDDMDKLKGSLEGKHKESSGGKGSSSSEIQPDEKLIEKDRYYDLNKQIASINSELEKQKAIYESANPKQRLEILKQENDLYKQLQNSIHNKAEEERKERSELVSNLSASGVKFTGEGDNLTATNAIDILNKKLANVNAHLSDKNKSVYKQLKADYDEYKAALDRFFDIQDTDLKNAAKDWWSYEQNVQSNHKETLNLLYTSTEETSANLDNLIKDAENKVKGLSDKNSDKKISVYQDEIKNATLAVNFWQSQMSLFKDSPELTQKAIDKMQQYDSTIQSASKSISDLINKQISLSVKGLDDIIKQEENAHQKRLDNIADEKKAFDNYIDDSIKKIEDQKSAEDYTDDVNKITKELNELQQKRNKLAMAVGSGDSEAIAQVTDLDKQIKEKQDDLTKKQKDRDYSLRKENLQNIKDAHDKEYDSRKDTEDKSYQALKDNYDKMKMEIDNFTNAGTDATTTMVDSIISSYQTLEKSFSSSTQNMANIFGSTFLSQLQNAKNQIVSISSSLGIANANQSSITTGKNISDYQKMYAEASVKSDWQGMQEANIQANILRGAGAVVTATDDINRVKNLINNSLSLKQADILSKLPKIDLVSNPPQLNTSFNNLSTLPKLTPNNNINMPITFNVNGSVDDKSIPKLENSFATILQNRLNNSGIMK